MLRAIAGMREAAVEGVLVGDGPERQRLEALAHELQIADRVTFSGATRDTAPSYREMDVFCLPSRTEQMPLSLLEAMASGLPVAGCDVGDVGRMLAEGATGGLVEAGDHAGLARALDALLADAARRAREGAQNRQRAEAAYELGACLDRYAAVYSDTAIVAK